MLKSKLYESEIQKRKENESRMHSIKNDIGWKSKVSLENGITMTIDKYKKILGENK